jgi:hypothetical protein
MQSEGFIATPSDAACEGALGGGVEKANLRSEEVRTLLDVHTQTGESGRPPRGKLLRFEEAVASAVAFGGVIGEKGVQGEAAQLRVPQASEESAAADRAFVPIQDYRGTTAWGGRRWRLHRRIAVLIHRSAFACRWEWADGG